MTSPRWLGMLLEQIATAAPPDILILAPTALEAAVRERSPSSAVTVARHPDVLALRQRHAWALVADAVETLPADAARELLAALRDRLAGHTLLIVDLARAPLSEQDLRGLGYRLHARDGARALFGFDLNDYKDRPDWLSPNNWANPELWDRFRW
jgi:hypothetical protein